MSAYAPPNEVLVYLIKQALDGSPERRVAAKFILDCLRNFRTREEIEACIHQFEEEALLDVGDEARQLAANIGLRVKLNSTPLWTQES
jgi:hypothetical protein